GPQGQNVVLMADAGGGQPVTNLNLTFDDNAANVLGEFDPLASGTYRPGNLGSGDSFPAPAPAGPIGAGLYTFRGANPNGTWSLYVLDDAPADRGSIGRGWVLTLSNEDPLQIVQQPESLAVYTGGTVSFDVVATGALPISYAWLRNGTNLTDGGRISGSATPVLTIPTAQHSAAA